MKLKHILAYLLVNVLAIIIGSAVGGVLGLDIVFLMGVVFGMFSTALDLLD